MTNEIVFYLYIFFLVHLFVWTIAVPAFLLAFAPRYEHQE